MRRGSVPRDAFERGDLLGCHDSERARWTKTDAGAELEAFVAPGRRLERQERIVETTQYSFVMFGRGRPAHGLLRLAGYDAFARGFHIDRSRALSPARAPLVGAIAYALRYMTTAELQ